MAVRAGYQGDEGKRRKQIKSRRALAEEFAEGREFAVKEGDEEAREEEESQRWWDRFKLATLEITLN